jgi:DNA-3-methyladenine glycosylase II
MRQAAAIKSRMSAQLGAKVNIHGDVIDVFPAPAVLREMREFKSVPERKIAWLHALSDAALAGTVISSHLRSGDNETRLEELRRLPGIGPMSAEHILVRGAGEPDRVTPMEPRLPRAIALAYELADVPGEEEIYRLAKAWRPFRTWVMVLLRVAFARDDAAGNARRG